MQIPSLPDSATTIQEVGHLPSTTLLSLLRRLESSPISTAVLILPTEAGIEQTLPLLDAFVRLPELSFPLEILPLPRPDEPSEDEEPLPESVREDRAWDRLTTLNALARQPKEERDSCSSKKIVFTTPRGLFAAVPNPGSLAETEIVLLKGEEISFDAFKERLATGHDYHAEAVCERPGEFAVRGGLIDVYPVNAAQPVRIEFFGDEIDSIRSFNPTSQRSTGDLGEVRIAPRHSVFTQSREEFIFEFFREPTLWAFLEPAETIEKNRSLFERFDRLQDSRIAFPALFERFAARDSWIAFTPFLTKVPFFPKKPDILEQPVESLELHRGQPLESDVGIERLEAEQSSRRQFLQTLATWQKEGARITAFLPKSEQLEEIRPDIKAAGLKKFEIIESDLPAGFILWDGPVASNQKRWVVVTPRELLGRHLNRKGYFRRRELPHRAQVDHLLDFSELVDGDYLVHLSHGICRYRGIVRMELRDREEEVISLEFDERVTLHVPLQESHLLSRYVGLTKSSPRLARLGGANWEKSRQAAEAATIDFASQLLSVQARRQQGEGHAFSPDSEWQRAFESAFPFRETEHQLQAIDATKQDMELKRPMDRLICGDVGFGKTEVAIRAAFKAVMDGFQVAIVVPTTVLAQQHFETFQERMAPYPVSVEMLSRFRSQKEQTRIVRQISEGKLDIVVGTHRLFSKDILFRKLGLLVIDEEHRFGVRHKERIKQLRSEVDILTMSATPIPRTLYLALMGARSLSVIETPPKDRLPIETIVRGYDPDVVKSAIQRELERGGQVFYLHNRVQSIQSVALKLQEMLPQAKIAVGHGQMTEHALEKVMTQFVAGDHDVLVCTTIIENGLDIPNCNTIIIEGADRFGLSQLYQLRGRVGRFNRQAYAYLLLHRHAHIVNLAKERLSALRQHNQLGAGFKIAMRDLELRGAGNLLGAEQSGHIAAIGFDLYCQLLRQSIHRLQGDPIASLIRATVKLDFILQGEARTDRSPKPLGKVGFAALADEEIESTRIDPVEASIPFEYIAETRLRMDLYRQLALAESTEVVMRIEEASRDRFGPPPPALKRLFTLTRIRTLAEAAGVSLVETEGNRLKCRIASSRKREFIKLGERFPRLVGKTPEKRLREIAQFLQREIQERKNSAS